MAAPMQGGNRKPGGRGQDAFASTGNYYLHINGGSIVVNAGGDGLDVNGGIEMTAGTVIVYGPTNQGNGALDYDSTFNLTGGTFVAAGSAGMAMAPSTSSTQNSVMVNLTSAQPAGTLFHIQNSAGEDVLTLAPVKDYQSVVFSSPELTSGTSYDIYLGGSYYGAVTNGVYQDGSYTAGTKYGSLTIADIVTTLGEAGGMMQRHP
jgi:hypothetical protein